MALILLVYPKYVGGKFIANCLALSQHCLIQDKTLAEKDMSLSTFDSDYYDFKLDSVLKSIPPRDKMRNWSKYEFGCKELYGIDEDFYMQNDLEQIRNHIKQSDIFNAIRASKRSTCIVTHDYKSLKKYLQVYPNAKVIDFQNFDYFRRLSATLKDPRPEHIHDDDYHAGKNFYLKVKNYYQLDSFSIDVDKTFLNWELFDEMMKRLYDYLQFDDYQPGLVKKFWEAYIYQPELIKTLWQAYILTCIHENLEL